jgi:O-antigen/teichoic acid export membrane protein
MESNKSDNTKRLAKNTVFLYGRSLFCLLVSLYSSRLILQALGVDDYGINNAVAGFASMFSLVTGSLSSAISRFLTIEQGTGNQERQKMVFSLSLNLMISFALIILLLAETIGVWFVSEKMTIPLGRETAAVWAFRFAVLTVMTGLIISPFNSAIISHERMGIYAIISILEAGLRLALALFLTFGHFAIDKLILYTGAWALCTIGFQSFCIIYCSIHFPECRFRLVFDKGLFKEMFGYAGWNFIGSVSGTLSGQGVNTLINVFLGPAVNAARGLSNTVQRAITMFVNNFTLALTPQITKAYATKDFQYTKFLTYRGTRFSFYILFFISLPVILETRFVFSLWLGEVPDHTVSFNRFDIIANLLGILFTLFIAVQNASGEIRNLNLIRSLIVLLHFPISWILLKLNFAPEMLYVMTLFSYVLLFFLVHHIVRKTLVYSYSEIIKEIYIPELKVIICSSLIPFLSVILLPYGWCRFLITGTLCVLFTIPSILYIGCSQSEREYIFSIVKNKISSLRGQRVEA